MRALLLCIVASATSVAIADDGIPDAADCPGCRGIVVVTTTSCQMVFLEAVYFESRRATISSRKQRANLDELATFLTSTPSIELVEIAGHTDDVGGELANLLLSDARASAALEYLVASGIDRARLVANGYGVTQPRTIRRSRNRRVEFVVLRRTP